MNQALSAKPDYSVSLEALDLLLAGWQSKGLATEDLLASIDEPRSFFNNPNNRLPSHKLGQLLINASYALNDETLGFLQRPTKLGGIQLALTSAVSGRNLREAMLFLARFCALVHDDMNLSLEEEAQFAKLTLNLSPIDGSAPVAQKPGIFVIMILLFLVRWMSWTVNQQILLNKVTLQIPAPVFADDVDTVFPCEYCFNHAENALIFNKDFLKLPLQKRAQDIPAFIVSLPHFVTTRLVDANLTGQVKRILKSHENIASLPLKVIAEMLNKSPQTIRRHLKEEGVTFAELKESARRDSAIAHLQQHTKSIKEIAYIVGFSEPSAFIRAFKNWTGMTPGDYREHYINPD